MIPALDVYLSCGPGGRDVLAGHAYFTLRRGSISTSFSYDAAYLRLPGATPIDPRMPLRPAMHHCDGIPGAFRDSAPDRWGRHLIARRAACRAGNGEVHTLDEVDYLVGVHDEVRQGALRYGLPGESGRLSPEHGVPPLVQLKRLVRSSDDIARGSYREESIRELLDAGSGSLGGARPKASVVDGDRLLLAKFSHPGDEHDVMGWEKTMLDMAAKAGIDVPTARIMRLGDASALVLERFDRAGSLLAGRRVPYVSAMTLLGAADGEQHDYIEVAEELPSFVADPAGQLRELYKRIAFSIAVHNTDDHLRNLGFVCKGKGAWQLAGLFDVNPTFDASSRRVTAIFGETGRAEATALAESAPYFGLGEEEARAVVAEVLEGVACWHELARGNGCPESEAASLGQIFGACTQALRSAFALR